MPIDRDWILADDTPSTTPTSLKSEAIARLAARRAAMNGSSVEDFLHPRMEHLHRGAGISGMEEACQRIAASVAKGEQILIYGDYDVDGVTSVVLLLHVIRSLGGKVDFVIPHRLFDGYGLKLSVLERVLAERDVKLVITVDCGITSIDAVEQALDRGIDVIVTDHHIPPGLLPSALAVLNPKKEGCDYPYKDLAGVGVAFKLACELVERHQKKTSVSSLLKIAALGTIADVAPLTGENRAIARIGLDGLSDPRNTGLRALLRQLNLLGKKVRASDVGFRIGPRINAAGRLASADTAIHLFGAKDDAEASALVDELNRLNGERQTIERAILEAADEKIAAMGELPRILVIEGEGWHRGVVGLCAGRIAQKYHRPTLVMSVNDEECVGSGRSIEGVDLHSLLSSVRESFVHFGGHEFACGFTLRREALAGFRSAITTAAESIDDDFFRRRVTIESALTFSELTGEFRDEYEQLEPFGAANRQPIFQTRGTKVGEVREFAEGCYSVMLQESGVWHSGVLWRSNRELMPLLSTGAYIDVLYHVQPDAYGRNGMRLEIVDARRN